MRSGTITDKGLQVVTFQVGNEQYGIHIIQVQEIIRIMESIKVPKAPGYVEGVVNLRGKIVPIIDLRKRMEKSVTPYSESSRIIVVDTNGRLAGLIVDTVIDIIMLSDNEIEPCPSIDDSIKKSHYIDGVGRKGDRLMTILNLENLLQLQDTSGIIA